MSNINEIIQKIPNKGIVFVRGFADQFTLQLIDELVKQLAEKKNSLLFLASKESPAQIMQYLSEIGVSKPDNEVFFIDAYTILDGKNPQVFKVEELKELVKIRIYLKNFMNSHANSLIVEKNFDLFALMHIDQTEFILSITSLKEIAERTNCLLLFAMNSRVHNNNLDLMDTLSTLSIKVLEPSETENGIQQRVELFSNELRLKEIYHIQVE